MADAIDPTQPAAPAPDPTVPVPDPAAPVAPDPAVPVAPVAPVVDPAVVIAAVEKTPDDEWTHPATEQTFPTKQEAIVDAATIAAAPGAADPAAVVATVEKVDDGQWTHAATDQVFPTQQEAIVDAAVVAAPAAAAGAPAVVPVIVDNKTVRSDDDAMFGSWVDVISGPNAGRFGAYVDTVHHDATGYPTIILIRTRDARNELLEVAYSDVRPSERTGGR